MTPEQAKQISSSLTPEQRRAFLKELNAYKEGAGTKEVPSTTRKIRAGYASKGFADLNISQALEDSVGEYYANKLVIDAQKEISNKPLKEKSEFERLLDKEYVEGAVKYQKERLGKVIRTAKLDRKLRQIDEFSDVWGTKHEESTPYLIGAYSNYVITPSSLIPMPLAKAGTLLKAVAPTAKGLVDAGAASLAGAALVGYDVAAWQLYEDGKLDMEQLALWSVGGAAMLPLITVGGKALSSWISGRIRNKTKVNPEEVGYALHTYLNNPKQDEHVAIFIQHYKDNQMMINPKLAALINSKVHPAKHKTIGDYIDDVMQSTSSITEGKKGKVLIKGKVDKKAHGKRYQDLKNAVAEDPRLYARKIAEIILTEEEEAIRLSKTALIANKKAKEMDTAWKARSAELSDVEKSTELAYKNAETELAGITSKYQSLSRIQQKKAQKLAEDTTEALDKYQDSILGDIRAQVDDLVEQTGIPAKKIQNTLDYGKEGGWASNMLIQHMGMAAAGGMVGGALGGKEGFGMGLMAGLAGSVMLVKGMRTETTLQAARKLTADNVVMESSLNRWLVRPTSVLNSLAAFEGRAMSKKFIMSEINMNMMVGKATNMFNKIYKPILSADLGKQFVRTMQGVEKSSDPRVVRAAKRTREWVLNPILDSAVKSKILTRAEAEAMKADKTFFPRVYNQMFLNSTEGQNLWIKKFSEVGSYKKESLENMIKSITGKGFDPAKKFQQIMYNPRTKKYNISADFARELYRQRTKDSISHRSTHLENKRKIHLDEEDFLNEFMIQDPQKVMMSYFHDAYKRISYAREFGAKDEIAEEFMSRLVTAGKDREHAYFKDLYYGAVGSEHSSIIRNRVNMSTTERNILGSVNAFETLKLTAAQVLNLTQATVNGITFASKYGGVRAIKAYTKGLHASFTKEGQEFAARTGAAIETTFMQLVSEANAHATITSAFGKAEFTGGLSFLNRINNPSKFLETIGFIYLEKGQRILAANMGRAFIDDILESRKLIENVINPTKAQQKQLSKYNSALDELNIPSSMSYEEIRANRHFMEQGAQSFSNIVNHTNSIEKLPIGLRGPYAATVFKFKSFAFHQAAFIQDHVIKPALEGNMRPLVGYLGVGGLGMFPDEIRRMVRSDDSKLSGTARYLRGLTSIGGAGLIWDGAITFTTNKNAAAGWSFLGGPAMGDAHRLSTSIYESFKNTDPRMLAKDVFKTIGGSYPFKGDIESIIGGVRRGQ